MRASNKRLEMARDLMARKIELTLPELGLVAMTRGVLGLGLGLLLGEALNAPARRAAGIALTAVGVLTTIPIALRIREELE